MRYTLLLVLSVGGGLPAGHAQQPPPVRFATYNASLNRAAQGELVRDLSSRDNAQAQRVAEIVQRVRPHVLLINEFDYDADGTAARLFQENYLAVGQSSQPPLTFPFRYTAPVNTGVPTGLDLDRDGQSDGPGDAYGFGRFAGQYGMAVYSMFPIERDRVRTFQKFLWKDMPQAMLPRDAAGQPYYGPAALEKFRLSSKSLWDLPIALPGGTVHLLASHPTPPVFDGPEDRNGRRNRDEIRLLADYVDPARGGYLVDDAGRRGSLATGAAFVVAGDMNADPFDGDSTEGAVRQLLSHPLVDAETTPASRGGPEKSLQRPAANAKHQGDPAHDTADFGRVGHLRVDYVLPSKNLATVAAGVFWPASDEAGHALVQASDHRLVWVDVRGK